MSAYDENWERLFQNGIMPIPITPAGVTYVAAKSPVVFDKFQNRYVGLAGWNSMTAPITEPQPDAGIGAVCGNGLVAMDYDCDDAAPIIAAAMGETPVAKKGQKGFTSFYFADFDVPAEGFYDADGKKVMDVLSKGRQTVLPPSLHPSGHPYGWINGHSLYDTRPDTLPRLPRDYKEKILALGYTCKKAKADITFDPQTGEIMDDFAGSEWAEINALALKRLDDWIHDIGLYGVKRNSGRYPSFRSVASFRPSKTGRPNEERAFNLNIHPKGITDTGDDHKGYSPIDLVMVCMGLTNGDAFEWLKKKLAIDDGPEIDIDIDACKEAQDDFGTEKKEARPDGENVRTYGRIRLTSYDAIPPEKLKRRLWLYRRHYLGGTVSSTVGDSGIGKTSLSLLEAVALSLGKDLLGDEKIKPHRVWYHNGEDTRDEINLRLGAICEYYRLDQNEVRKNLTITCGLDMPVEVAAGTPPVIDKKLVQDIADAITGEGFEVAIFDPLITVHQVNENGTEIRTVLRSVFARVANFTGCAIELPHHTRKLFPGAEEATADDARGSSEIKAAVRGMRMASLMTKAEAELYQISETERLSYFKTYSAKANMTKRGNVYWYRIESHELPNGVPEENIPGESVGVVTRWEAPNMIDPLTLYTLDDKKFWYQAAVDGSYRYDKRSPDWFGFAIGERLKLKTRTNAEHKRQAASILEALIEEGVLKLESDRNEKGRSVAIVTAGERTWEGATGG